MVELGKYNVLKINRFADFGAYLDGEDLGEILLPKRYLPKGSEKGDELDVFIFLDNEERYIATTDEVYAQVGEFGYLKIMDLNEHGAFADWGLSKDLFIPYREQKTDIDEGMECIVYVYIDEKTNRITGTTKVDKYISEEASGLKVGEQYDGIVYRKTPSGFLCIIDNRCLGMLYSNQIFQQLRVGDRIAPFVKKIRSDKKVDLTLAAPGYGTVEDFSDELYNYLKRYKFSYVHDKSDPGDIKRVFGVSKKVFKKAVGKLYKEKKIVLSSSGIQLATKSE